MTYTPINFRNDMIREIEKGYDPVRVAQVAFVIIQELGAKISTEFHNEILGIAVMEEGPQFKMTEAQLREYLDRMVGLLSNHDKSWIEVINTLKVGDILKVTVTKHRHFGFFVDVPDTKYEGLVEIMHIKDEKGVSPIDFPAIGSEIEAIVLGFREHNHQIVLSIKPSDLSK